ncbi:recombinase family protein [Chishuiella sp.]|uniref:recombinase family protein n=1 Tax=Chishuiella sp. TaxID=1969467 RepID=UPI0028AB5CE9|nr:recombinase family protein [Chishuiella sp.]
MKKVVGYARISREDQSHFSIFGQVEQIQEYCNRNHYDLIDTFIDEGQSAKDFDRKAWKKLEEFLKINHKNIDYFVVMKYDRFSRNLHESLSVIQRLEEVYKIKIISLHEPIGIPVDSPFFFQMRTQMLLQAHVERLVISKRTKFGIDSAKKQGRFLGVAPYGYKNDRDENGKPIILENPEEAKIVNFIFGSYLENYSFTETTRLAKKIGFSQKAREAVFRILSNHIYIGEIKFKLEDGSIIYLPGIHKPLISEEIFNRVQALISRTGKVINRFNDIAYLKGAIICPNCGKLLTACKSKGKYKYYWYYECAIHRKSYNVDVANNKFDKILDELNFEDYQIDYLKQKIEFLLQDKFENGSGDLGLLNKKKASILSKKSKLEEKYLDDKLDDEIYSTWHNSLKKELSEINIRINDIKNLKSNFDHHFSNSISYLSSLKSVFHLASTPEKLKFVEMVFGRELIYDGNIYRTHFINPLFVSKVLILKGKKLLEYVKNQQDFPKSSLSNHDET